MISKTIRGITKSYAEVINTLKENKKSGASIVMSESLQGYPASG